MTHQKEWWAGEGGNAYTHRNRVNWLKRVPFWTDMMVRTGARRVYEVGCNYGANLLAIRAVSHPETEILGMDVNEMALRQANYLGFDVQLNTAADCAEVIRKKTNSDYFRSDLVFTVGVLIHIPTAQLAQEMQAIIDISREYVLSVEYEAGEEQEVRYRDEDGLLWRRPYGAMYQAMGLTEVANGELFIDDGFDNCKWHLMKKPT